MIKCFAPQSGLKTGSICLVENIKEFKTKPEIEVIIKSVELFLIFSCYKL